MTYRLVVLKVAEPRFWYQPVTPHTAWYENVTAMYIRKVQYQYTYAKHQHSTWVRIQKRVVVYIPTL